MLSYPARQGPDKRPIALTHPHFFGRICRNLRAWREVGAIHELLRQHRRDVLVTSAFGGMCSSRPLFSGAMRFSGPFFRRAPLVGANEN